MKVAIIGSRNFIDKMLLEQAIQESGFNITEECCGEAPGADTLGRVWAEEKGIPVVSFPADWDNLDVPGAIIRVNAWGKKYNVRAGKDRNTKMITYADAIIAFWDGSSPGTRHSIREAERLKKPIFIKQFHTD